MDDTSNPGEAKESGAETPREATEPVPSPFTPVEAPRASAPRSRSPIWPLVGGAIAGAVVSGVMLLLFHPAPLVSPEVARRLAAFEQAATTLDKRVGALEAAQNLVADKLAGVSAFGPRLSALEAAAPDVEKAADAAKADAAKALLAARPADQAPAPPQPDPALDARIAKLETALAAPKSVERAAPETAAPEAKASLQAVAAEALESRFAAGAPYMPELAALERLGVDAAHLAPLKAFADSGAPGVAALATQFAALAPALTGASAPTTDDGVVARLSADMGRLVRVHPVGERPGDDPEAVVSQISAALARGDTAGALADFARLPAAAQEVGKGWAAATKARGEAAVAASALLDEPMARLGAAKN